jgi:hypothetical protein
VRSARTEDEVPFFETGFAVICDAKSTVYSTVQYRIW